MGTDQGADHRGYQWQRLQLAEFAFSVRGQVSADIECLFHIETTMDRRLLILTLGMFALWGQECYPKYHASSM
jgi:hypothetical protein